MVVWGFGVGVLYWVFGASEYYECDLEVGRLGKIAITSSLELVSLREQCNVYLISILD